MAAIAKLRVGVSQLVVLPSTAGSVCSGTGTRCR
jgi:hypothetical protein